MLEHGKVKRSIKGCCSLGLAVAALVVAAAPASAATITWTSWTSGTVGLAGTAQGTMTPLGVTVSYAGEVNKFYTSYPSWTPVNTYSGGTVDNAPPGDGGIVGLNGGSNTGVNTITFSTPVVDPVMAIWSLGQTGTPASFEFNSSEPFTIEAGGSSTEYGGQAITASGYTVNGIEGNGTIQFHGTFTTLSWSNPQRENWYGFTVGAPSAVPAPASVWLFGLGMIGLGLVAQRRWRRQVRAGRLEA